MDRDHGRSDRVLTRASSNGVVYVGSNDAKLYAFDANGVTNCSGGACTPLWTATTGGAIASSPSVAGGVVYVGSNDGKVYAINADGTPRWTGSTGGPIASSPAVANGVVYVGSNDAKLYAFNAAGTTNCTGATCTPLWTATTGGPVTSSPAVANGTVYVGSNDAKLYTLTRPAPRCGPRPPADPSRHRPRSPAASSTSDRTTPSSTAFNAAGTTNCTGATCTPLWTATTGGPVTSSPAVANGVVYVGSNDAKLYAFTTAGSTAADTLAPPAARSRRRPRSPTGPSTSAPSTASCTSSSCRPRRRRPTLGVEREPVDGRRAGHLHRDRHRRRAARPPAPSPSPTGHDARHRHARRRPGDPHDVSARRRHPPDHRRPTRRRPSSPASTSPPLNQAVNPAGAVALRRPQQPDCTNAGPAPRPRRSARSAPARPERHRGQDREVAAGTYTEKVTVVSSGPRPPGHLHRRAGRDRHRHRRQQRVLDLGRSWVTVHGFTVTGTDRHRDQRVVVPNVTIDGNHVTNAGVPVQRARRNRDQHERHDAVRRSPATPPTTTPTPGIYVTRRLRTTTRSAATRRSPTHAGTCAPRPGIDLRDSTGNVVYGNVSHDNEDSGINIWTGADAAPVFEQRHLRQRRPRHRRAQRRRRTHRRQHRVRQRRLRHRDDRRHAGADLANNVSVDNGINSPRTSGNIRVDSGSAARHHPERRPGVPRVAA